MLIDSTHTLMRIHSILVGLYIKLFKRAHWYDWFSRINYNSGSILRSSCITDGSKFVDEVCLSKDSRFLCPTQPVSVVHAQQLHIPLSKTVRVHVSALAQALAVGYGPPAQEVLVLFFHPR